MGPMRCIAAAACSAMLLTSAATTASAQTTSDRMTFVTFSGPVSIPGKTLPAGTYTFKLADSPADRHIVQVFDKDQTQLIATLLAVSADRTEASGDPVIRFKETPSDRPPALHYWYYAGERAGNEFVYPKSQAMMIARASGESVMAADSDSSNVDDWKSGQPTRVTADMAQSANASATPAVTTPASTTSSTSTTSSDTTPQTTTPQTTPAPTTPAPTTTAPTTTAPITAAPTTTAPTTTAAPATVPDQPQQPTTAPAPARAPMAAPPATAPTTPTTPAATAGTSGRSASSELPHTASEIPAVGLVGLLALAGALAVGVARRATA
jgi:hypothetical protein